MSRIARYSGLAAMAGGVLWTVGIALYALSVAPPYREFGFSGAVLPVAVPLLVVGVLGLWAGYGNRAGGTGMGVAVLTIAGTAVFVVSALSGLPWALVMLGFYGASLGSLLMGAVALHVGALPRPVAAALIAGSFALYFFNDQSAVTVLMALPFGVAWAAVGYALFRREVRPPAGGVGIAPPRSGGPGWPPEAAPNSKRWNTRELMASVLGSRQTSWASGYWEL